MRVLVIGGGAREHAMCKAVARGGATLFSVMKNLNPGIKKIAKDYLLENELQVSNITEYAQKHEIDLMIVGPEAPEEAGIVDFFKKEGIATASPTKKAAEIETDKEYMRGLMKKHNICGSLRNQIFSDPQKALTYIESLGGKGVIKPIGLTGGKGVKVAGDHFKNVEEAHHIVTEIITKKIGGKPRVLIEEKAEGEEFTLQAFCDGSTILPVPAVQDHKRLLPGDKGPNTGGMGSYSQADGLLPFLDRSDYEEACTILQDIIEALSHEKRPYHGAIYGQFMLTSEGPKVIEINARWGDPEAMNVLPLLKSNFVEICKAMVTGDLDKQKISFYKKATVCKYVVPEGYGYTPRENSKITVDEQKITRIGGEIFYASVNKQLDHILTTTSRSLAVLGIAPSISQAEKICEQSLHHVKGDHIFIRNDIGTSSLIQKRIEHMRRIRG
jgi:phosphoribosylamine--glycine ligase